MHSHCGVCARGGAGSRDLASTLRFNMVLSGSIVEPLDSCSPDLYVGHRASTASAAPKYTKGVLELGGVVLL